MVKLNWKQHLSETTAHGLGHIAKENSIFKRVMWVFFTLLALSIFVFHTSLLVINLREQKVSTTITHNVADFPQPYIYFCFDRVVSNSYLRNPPIKDEKIMKVFSSYTNRLKLDLRDSFFHGGTHTEDVPLTLNRILSFVPITEFFKAVGHRMTETLLSAKCNGKEMFNSHEKTSTNAFISYRNMASHKYHLACLKMTPADCGLSTPWDSIDFEFYIHNQPVNDNDMNNKIKVNYRNKNVKNFIDVPYNMLSSPVTDDIFVYFEHLNCTVDPKFTMVTASPYTHTEIHLSASLNKYVDRKTSPCLQTIKKLEFLNQFNARAPIIGNYHIYRIDDLIQETCMKKENRLLVDFLIPSRYNLPNKTFYLAHKRLLKSAMDYLKYKKFYLQNRDHEIKKLCHEVEYKIRTADSIWPTKSTLIDLLKSKGMHSPGIEESLRLIKKDTRYSEMIKHNVYKISIRKSKAKATLVQERVIYTWTDLISDVGGIMGFYLGASVLTLCELVKILFGCSTKSRQQKCKDQEPWRSEEDAIDENKQEQRQIENI